jgi:hypothetical protein
MMQPTLIIRSQIRHGEYRLRILGIAAAAATLDILARSPNYYGRRQPGAPARHTKRKLRDRPLKRQTHRRGSGSVLLQAR